MPPMGLEPTISAAERPQTCALDRAATGAGSSIPLAVHYSFTVPFDTIYTGWGKGRLTRPFCYNIECQVPFVPPVSSETYTASLTRQ